MSQPRRPVDREAEIVQLVAAFARLTTWDRVYLARHYPELLEPIEQLSLTARFQLTLD